MDCQPKPPRHIVRLMDASLNRASEGARVVEDYARFVLNDAHLSQLAKTVRHGIAAAGSCLSDRDRLATRDTPGDVGTAISTASEGDRADAWSVCQASLGRLQEALRSLEEYGKTIDPELGPAFERLRYTTYTLAKGLGATRAGASRLESGSLYVLVDGRESPEAFESLVESIAEAGADVIQLRDKGLDDRTLAQRARVLAAACRSRGVLSIVNDRPDIAAVAGVDGVHVGQEELSVADARGVLGTQALVGVSTHSIEQARAAVLAGADYLGVGPTFPTETKRFERFPGVDLVRSVACEISLPAFAIGGINAANLGSVRAAGLSRVAVSSAITGVKEPARAVRDLKAMLTAPVGGEKASG